MRCLTRYLVRELWLPLVLWLAFLFVLLFVMQLLRGTDVLLGSAITLRDFGGLVLFLAPHFLVMALPAAYLLAILLGMGRLAEDGELVAMRALGVSPVQLLRVPVAGAVGLGALMLLLHSTAEPWGLEMVKRVVNELIKKNVAADVKPGVFYDDLTQLTLYTQAVDPVERRWTNVLIHDNRDPAAPLLVLARGGYLVPSAPGEAMHVRLEEGHVHRAGQQGAEYAVVDFERGELSVGLEGMYLKQNRFRWSDAEYTPADLLEAAREAEARGEDPRPWRMTFHWRLAQVLAPLSFAVLGTPLAMGRRRGGRGWGVLLTLLGYVGYYVLSRFFESLGAQGKLPPLLAAQLPNVVFIGLGALVLSRMVRAGR